jgi:enoyl-CoA hydratase
VLAASYTPQEAAAAGFLDMVVPADELLAASLEAAAGLAQLDAKAHAETKLRARAGALQAVREAIETELTLESLTSS